MAMADRSRSRSREPEVTQTRSEQVSHHCSPMNGDNATISAVASTLLSNTCEIEDAVEDGHADVHAETSTTAGNFAEASTQPRDGEAEEQTIFDDAVGLSRSDVRESELPYPHESKSWPGTARIDTGHVKYVYVTVGSEIWTGWGADMYYKMAGKKSAKTWDKVEKVTKECASCKSSWPQEYNFCGHCGHAV